MTDAGISSRYALALIEALSDPSSGVDPAAALAGLNEFTSVFESNRDLRTILLSPAVLPANKRALLAALSARLGLPRLIQNFLMVLSDHRRMALLKTTAESAALLLDERLGFVRASITAAAPLSEDEQGQLAARLEALTGKRVRMRIDLDPGLVGGLIARVGSKVYDGSVRGQLQIIGRELVAQSG